VKIPIYDEQSASECGSKYEGLLILFLRNYSSRVILVFMKKEIHPDNYRPVIFADNSSGAKFLIPSTIVTKETAKWTDGKEYPMYGVEISSASHPFYTNEEKTIDTAGRVEKFKTRKAKATVKK